MTGDLPYNFFDLGSCERGDIWRVDLDWGANVFMVDQSNFSSFKSGRDFTHYGGGGLITRSPHDFVVPRAGRFYIVAHTWGLRDSARISVTNIPQLRPMSPATPTRVDLASIARDAAVYPGGEAEPPTIPEAKKHDVFISHARPYGVSAV